MKLEDFPLEFYVGLFDGEQEIKELGRMKMHRQNLIYNKDGTITNWSEVVFERSSSYWSVTGFGFFDEEDNCFLLVNVAEMGGVPTGCTPFYKPLSWRIGDGLRS